MKGLVVVTIAFLWTVASVSAETTAIDTTRLSADQAAELRRSAAANLKRLAEIDRQLAEVRKLRRSDSTCERYRPALRECNHDAHGQNSAHRCACHWSPYSGSGGLKADCSPQGPALVSPD